MCYRKMSDDEVMLQKVRKMIGEKEYNKKKVNWNRERITIVNRMQLRRDNSGDYYIILYVDHSGTENVSCILLAEDGTLRKELTKIVGTWKLISDSNDEPYICDLFFKNAFKNL